MGKIREVETNKIKAKKGLKVRKIKGVRTKTIRNEKC